MDAISGTPNSSPARLDFDAEAKKAYATLGSVGAEVKATAQAEVSKVQGTFDTLNALAKTSGFAEKALKDGVAAFIRARAAEAARNILAKHPNAAALGEDALAKATTAIIVQGVIADLSRANEAAKVLGGFKGANEAFVAGLKAAYAQPLEHAYGEIQVTVPSPAPQPPKGGSPAPGGEAPKPVEAKPAPEAKPQPPVEAKKPEGSAAAPATGEAAKPAPEPKKPEVKKPD